MIIKEFLPNPVGNDKEGEYIKLFNSDAYVSLDGWLIKNLSGKTYKLEGSLGAGEDLILPYSKTKIALNNSGETIFLYNNYGNLVDSLGYIGSVGVRVGQVIKKDFNITKDNLTAGELTDSKIINASSNAQEIIFIDLLISLILAGLSLYIILKFENKFGEKLF